MKTIIAALMLVLLAVGATFAASSHARHLHEGRNSYVPQFGYYGNWLRLPPVPEPNVERNPPNPSGGIPGA